MKKQNVLTSIQLADAKAGLILKEETGINAPCQFYMTCDNYNPWQCNYFPIASKSLNRNRGCAKKQ